MRDGCRAAIVASGERVGGSPEMWTRVDASGTRAASESGSLKGRMRVNAERSGESARMSEEARASAMTLAESVIAFILQIF